VDEAEKVGGSMKGEGSVEDDYTCVLGAREKNAMMICWGFQRGAGGVLRLVIQMLSSGYQGS
jgi:hypothetical protein